MAIPGLSASESVLAPSDLAQLTRRALLRAFGAVTGLAATAEMAGTLPGPGLASAQETPAAGESTVGTRTAGGPNLEDVAFDLEFDPEKIFRFVVDEIAYESYSGALRGAKGAHWSLAGNSVDQAILLAELLTAALVPVRFAAGELTEDAASMLLNSMVVNPTIARERAQKVSAAGEIDLTRHGGLSPEQLRAIQSPEGLRGQLLEFAGTQLADGLATIEAALASESISLPVPALDLTERERSQHVWIQYSSGTEWIDLDPTVPGSSPGQAYATQTEAWDALPDELFHRIRFRAVIEKISSGEAVREDLFIHESRAANLVGVPVVFAHVDPSAFRALGVAINGLVDGSTQYVPTLLAGEEGETGTAVIIGSTGGLFEGLGTSENEGEAIAEWLEIDVLPVDGAERQIRREIFDRIGADRRVSGTVDLAALPPVELIDDPKLGKVFLPLEAVRLIGVVGGQIPGTYFQQDFATDDVEADMALLVHSYHAARDWLQLEVAAQHGYRWYHNQPNLTAAVVTSVRTADDEFAISASLDLLHQGYGLVPYEGTDSSVHPTVVAGVLAHVAERVGAQASAALTPETPPPAGSVAEVFQEAARAGLTVQTLMPGSSGPSNLAISDVAKARISEALSAGYVVVVPERAVSLGGVEQVGWWQVDTLTGATFDLMENGMGFGPLGEDTVIIVGGPAWRAATAWKVLSFVIGVIVGFSAVMAIMMYPN